MVCSQLNGVAYPAKTSLAAWHCQKLFCFSFAFSNEWSDTHSPSAGVVCAIASCHESSFVHGPKDMEMC